MQKDEMEVIGWDTFLQRIREGRDEEGHVTLSDVIVRLAHASSDDEPDASIDLVEFDIASFALDGVRFVSEKAGAEEGGEEKDEDEDEAYIRICAVDREPSIVLKGVRCCWVDLAGSFSRVSFEDVHFERLACTEGVRVEQLWLNGHLGVLKMGAGEDEDEVQYEHGAGVVEEIRFNGVLLKEFQAFLPPRKVYMADEGITGEVGGRPRYFTCDMAWVRIIRAYDPEARFSLSIDLSES
jgi:hypothetical protein